MVINLKKKTNIFFSWAWLLTVLLEIYNAWLWVLPINPCEKATCIALNSLESYLSILEDFLYPISDSGNDRIYQLCCSFNSFTYDNVVLIKLPYSQSYNEYKLYFYIIKVWKYNFKEKIHLHLIVWRNDHINLQVFNKRY